VAEVVVGQRPRRPDLLNDLSGRHTFSSRPAQQGISLYKIMKWLGHSSMQVTQIYAHFVPAYDQDIEKLTIQTNGELNKTPQLSTYP